MGKVHVNAILVCDYLIQAQGGKTTLAGIFQNIFVKEFPAGKDPMGIYVNFASDPGLKFEICIVGPEGSEMPVASGVTAEHPIDSPFRQHATVVAGVASPIVFPVPGVYSIVLKVDGELVQEYPIGVFETASSAEGE